MRTHPVLSVPAVPANSPSLPTRVAVPALGLALLFGGIPALPAAAAEPGHAPVGGVFTLVGRGYGHGRGMSQWGSYQQAVEGRSWQQIVAFYYPGATVATLPAGTIRVNTAGRTGGTVRVAAEAGLTATDGAGQTIALPTTDASAPITSWEVAPPTSGGSATTATLWFRTATGRKALRSTESGGWSISAADGTLDAQNSSGTRVATYQGSFTGTRQGTAIVPVLITSLESYTRQVVPWESYASWPTQALAAQAVAARSYGAWYVAHPRSPLYDICDTTACQVFGGLGAQTPTSEAGVTASAGAVLTVGGAAIRSEFSASNGGQVADPGSSYAVAKPDPYEMRLPTTVTTWKGSVSAVKLQARYPQVGTVTSLAVAARDGQGQWGGRVTALRLSGTTGSVTLTPTQLGALVTGWKGAYFALADGPGALDHDWSGDGRPEQFSRDATGALISTEFAPGGVVYAARTVGTGWGGFSQVTTGQFTADRLADALALTATGVLKLYPSRGGSWGVPTTIATGMTGYSRLAVAAALGGRTWLLALRSSDGALVGWPANGTGGLATTTPTVLSPAGWAGKGYTAMLAVRDLCGDATSDVVVRTSAGDLLCFAGSSTGRFGAATRIGSGWNGFSSIASPGDVNGDARSDLLARKPDGTTWLYATRATGGFLPGARQAVAATAATLLP